MQHKDRWYEILLQICIDHAFEVLKAFLLQYSCHSRVYSWESKTETNTQELITREPAYPKKVIAHAPTTYAWCGVYSSYDGEWILLTPVYSWNVLDRWEYCNENAILTRC